MSYVIWQHLVLLAGSTTLILEYLKMLSHCVFFFSIVGNKWGKSLKASFLGVISLC